MKKAPQTSGNPLFSRNYNTLSDTNHQGEIGLTLVEILKLKCINGCFTCKNLMEKKYGKRTLGWKKKINERKINRVASFFPVFPKSVLGCLSLNNINSHYMFARSTRTILEPCMFSWVVVDGSTTGPPVCRRAAAAAHHSFQQLNEEIE